MSTRTIKLVAMAVILLLWGGIIWYLVKREAARTDDVILWTPWKETDPSIKNQEATMRRLKSDLELHRLSTVFYESLPLETVLLQLEDQISLEFPALETIQLRMHESLTETVPINLRLNDVPIAETLRFLGYLTLTKLIYTNERVVEIASLEFSPPAEAYEKGWITLPDNPFHQIAAMEKKVDIRLSPGELGFDIPVDGVADYYPKQGLLWVEAPYEELKFLHDYSSRMINRPPGLPWHIKVADWWYNLTNPATNHRPVADPFNTP